MRRKSLYLLGVPLLTTLWLSGCYHDDDKMAAYEVSVTNLSESQPLSPPALVLHRTGYRPWQVGSAASDGLEQLAEGGDPDAWLTEAAADHRVKATVADSAVILPGASSSVMIEGDFHHDLALSLATMLVNTNDGFTGLNGESLSGLSRHATHTVTVGAYDAGTEGNSESAVSVPGPAAGGEGYSPARDDRDTVGGHPGVISADDGLSGSALHAEHRFDNPVARITITRLE
jgi:hypothetical protein